MKNKNASFHKVTNKGNQSVICLIYFPTVSVRILLYIRIYPITYEVTLSVQEVKKIMINRKLGTKNIIK